MNMPSTYGEYLAKRLAKRRGVMAFTLLEVLIALAIFLLLIVGIYASWSQILRATRVGLEAAADNQRKRVAMRALEQSLGKLTADIAAARDQDARHQLLSSSLSGPPLLSAPLPEPSSACRMRSSTTSRIPSASPRGAVSLQRRPG